jgi:hypothetical protein
MIHCLPPDPSRYTQQRPLGLSSNNPHLPQPAPAFPTQGQIPKKRQKTHLGFVSFVGFVVPEF